MINKVKIIFIYLLLTAFSPTVLSNSAQPVDLRIVVDISGDVRKFATDSQHLDALKLMINTLPAGSKAGVWTYGKYVNHFVQHDAITSSWLKSADINIDKIRSVASNRNIYSALQKAAFDLDRSSTTERHILLLSSGNIAVGDDQANRKSRDLLLTSLLPRIMDSGIKVHSLSLSDNSGSELLYTLSKETGGYAFVANNPDQMIYFGHALVNSFNPANYIPIHDSQFAVDDNITDFTLSLIGSEMSSVSVISPSGKKFSNEKHDKAKWLQEKRFVRMQLKDPELGQWKISGQVSPESRVFVSGGNSLELNGLAAAYITNESIILSAKDQNAVRKAGTKSFIDDAQVSIAVGGLEGRAGAGENSEKRFSQLMTAETDAQGDYKAELQGLTTKGLYRFSAVIKTLDYERGLDKLVQVNELFTMDISTTQTNNNLAYNINIIPADNDIDLDKTTIIATVSDSAGKWTVRTVEFEPDVGWQLILEDDHNSKEYKVELDFKGSTFSGRAVHYRPKPLIIELPRPVINDPIATVIDSGLNKKSGLNGADVAPAGVLTETPSSTSAQPVIEAIPDAQTENGNSWILVIAGVCLLLGTGIILFYFWEPIKKSFAKKAITKEQAIKEPDASRPREKVSTISALSSVQEGLGNPPIIQSVVDSDSEEFRHSETKSAQSSDLRIQRAEKDTPITKEPSPAMGEDGEFEVDLNFDLDLTEETELASEWRDLDAESNLSEKVENEIEIDFDDPDKFKSAKKG